MSAAVRPSRFLTDAALLNESRVDVYRGSGPGGQKRNKTSNAVRLVHLPTGAMVTATECRSLKENQLQALRRLRLKLSADFREPVDLEAFALPDWWATVRRGERLSVSHRHPLYPAAGGLLLDLLSATGGQPAAAALKLGVSTTSAIKLLASEPVWWVAANRIRAERGQPALARR